MYDYGYVKVGRSIASWHWYKDPNTFRVYMHLLLKANYTDINFRGRTIKRGQVIISRNKIAEDLNLSEQQVRTAIEHLKSTKDITIEKCVRYVIITINSYNIFDFTTNNSTNNSTEYQPDNNHKATTKQPLYNNKRKNNKNNNKFINARSRERNESFSLEDFERKALFL